MHHFEQPVFLSLIILICAFHVGCLFIFHKVHCSSCQSASGEYSSGCSLLLLLLLLLLYFFTIVYIFNLFRSITVYLNVAGFSSPTVVSCQCTAVCSTLLLLLGTCARAIFFWERALFVYLIAITCGSFINVLILLCVIFLTIVRDCAHMVGGSS